MPNKITPSADRPMPMGETPMGRQSAKAPWLKGLITLIVILIIIGAGICLIGWYTGIGSDFYSPTKGIVKADWQAVFLANGQVYFGKVTSINEDFVTLQNIYYLQVITMKNNAIAQPPDVQTQPDQQLTLIKLGNEIHGPVDVMNISRSQIVIIEDLKNDSRVVTAINDYLNKQKAAPAK